MLRLIWNGKYEDEPHGRVADSNDELLSYCFDKTRLNLLYCSLYTCRSEEEALTRTKFA